VLIETDKRLILSLRPKNQHLTESSEFYITRSFLTFFYESIPNKHPLILNAMPPRNSSDLKDPRPGKIVKKRSPEQQKWELANIHLKSNNLDEAKKVLITLTKRPNPFNLRATKLLLEMSKQSTLNN
jgi:hypothetical protein